jgi:peptidoglycan/xylan/chitin deacetylase (PgdA/CDA1 family)
MHRFFIKTPWLVKQFYKSYIWNFSRNEHAVYLTFDDGPHPTITPWVLEQLKRHNARATFFCVGENVEKHSGVYQRILDEGHAVGNHTQHHPNGWHTASETYLADIKGAANFITSQLFRPPYGRIKKSQANGLKTVLGVQTKIIMWDVLSCDFDPLFSKEQCLKNVLSGMQAGSIIVFHDSEKAAPNLMYVLPLVLEQLAAKGYALKSIQQADTLLNK